MFTGDVTEPEGNLPFREGVVTASLLLVLPTLPDGEGVGDMGDGVSVILCKQRRNITVSSIGNGTSRVS